MQTFASLNGKAGENYYSQLQIYNEAKVRLYIVANTMFKAKKLDYQYVINYSLRSDFEKDTHRSLTFLCCGLMHI
jgi:hypothetical protein